MKSTSHHATLRLMVWTGTWALTVALATLGPRIFWGTNRVLTLVALVINIGAGLGMILSNRNHLKANDELQQKIQLEAMAVTLGAGLVGGIAYTIMEKGHLISGDAEISHLIIFMALTYMVSIVVGNIRFS